MWLFLIILFLLGFLHTVLNLSLFERKINAVVFSILLAVISFLMFPFAIRLNMETLARFMHSFAVLSSVCTYQIVESIAIMFLSVLLIKDHCLKGWNFAVRLPALLPSGMFLAGLFFLNTYLVNAVGQLQFYQTALVLSLALFIILWGGSFAVRRLFPRWEWRIELKVILSFLQMFLSMFLPLIVLGAGTGQNQLGVDFKAAALVLAVMAVIVFIGYLRQIYYEKRGLT